MKRLAHLVRLSYVLLISAAVELATGPLQAATYTWDVTPGTVGGGNSAIDDGSGTWDTSNGNWTSDGGANNVAWSNNTTDIAGFNGSSGGVVTVSGSFSAGGLSFSGAGANSYTFSGAGNPTLTLGTGGITVNSAAGAQTFDNTLPLSLSSGQSWINGSAASLLTVNGAVSAATTAALTIDGAGNTTLGGVLSNGAGTLSLSKGGAGTLLLSAPNTYTGVTMVDAGTLTLSTGANVTGSTSVVIDIGALKLSNATGTFFHGTDAVAHSLTLKNGADMSDFGAIKIGTTTNANGNTVLITDAGTTVKCTTGNSANSFWVGDLGSSNRVTIANGATVDMPKGNGGQSMDVGRQFGANGNALTVTGAGSKFNGNPGGATSPLTVGAGGSYNTLTVSDGGYCAAQRFIVGATGSNNAIVVTGPGSLVTFNGSFGNNPYFQIGEQAGSLDNSFAVRNGASASFSLNSRPAGVGSGNGANSNAITIAGAGSSFTLVHTGLPLTIGFGSAATGDASSGNHLDVFGGGTAILNASVLLRGTNTSFNLGDGTGISTATVSAVVLSVPDARLNFNGGVLVADTADALVSGPGMVALNGPGDMSTAFTNSIDSVITGPGDLTKLDTGTLTLSAINTHSGETIVAQGVLRLTHDHCLSVETAVRIESGAMIDLAFTGENTVDALYIDGNLQFRGLYGSGRLPSHLSGSGYLRTLSGGEPTGVSLIFR